MEGLRDDQVALLARHRERAFDALMAASAAYEGMARLRETPEGKTLLGRRRELQVSIAVSAAAAAVERRRLHAAAADEGALIRLGAADAFPVEVLDALKRRRLPFAAVDVELVLDLGAETLRGEAILARSFETLALGVSAASNLLREEPGSAAVLGALERAGSAIDALRLTPTSNPGSLLRRVRSLIAENVPGGLLDLSILETRDAWAEPAGEVLRRHAARWDGVHELLALLAAARTTRPSQTWRRKAFALAAQYDGHGDLLRELLEPILEIELTQSGEPWPPAWLLAPGNEILARGATWATADVEAPWVVPLLGRLALRGAAPSPHPTVTTALAHGVASGAIEALAAIGTPEAHAELRLLVGEIRRRDLLKRIAQIVGETDSETAARDDRVRREKARAVSRKADPEPKERQRIASAYARRDLAPALREVGFDDSAGRTYWRQLDDRVETIHCKAHKGGLTLELGIWFPFIPRWYSVPERDGALRPNEFHCDIRGKVHAWSDDLGSAAGTADLWFARWRPLQVVLRSLDEGLRSEEAFTWGAVGSPAHALVTGYLAREVGDRDLARERLSRAAAYFGEKLEEERPLLDRDVLARQESWIEVLERDAAAL